MNAPERVMMKHWVKVCAVDDIPQLGARVVKSVHGDIAVFRNAENEIFALLDKCPHKGGPLSQGIVFGEVKLCEGTFKSGDNIYECSNELDAKAVAVGTKITVWMAYVMPKGDEIADLALQVKLGDVVRETRDMDKFKGDMLRSRTWTLFTPKKAGNYTLNIMRGDKVLKSVSFTAVDAPKP